MLLSCVFSVASYAAEEILVPAGGDVAMAIREAREMRRLHRISENDTLFITLQGGKYLLTEPLLLRPEDSGTKLGPTVIRASQDGEAVFEGGIELKGWRRPTREELKGVPARVQDQVWVCPAPRVNGRIVETRQLWREKESIQSGPHFRAMRMASLMPNGKMLPLKGFDKLHRTIHVGRELPKQTKLRYQQIEADIKSGWTATMLVHQRWATALLRVKDIKEDPKNFSCDFTFYNPESRREFEHPWPQPVINDTIEDGRVVCSSYDLMGLPCLLDEPGEWLQRYPDGLIYVISGNPGGEAPDYPICIPVTEQLVQVDGSLERPVHDILFRGVCFQHTGWSAPDREGWVTLQAGFPIVDAYKLQEPGLPEKATLENQAWIGRPQSAVTLRGARRVSFERCEFRSTGACGLDYVEASSDCRISGCRFEDIGATAVLIGHFPSGGFETHVPFKPNVADDLCHDITIEHNSILGVGMEDRGACAINAGYVFNTTIARNHVKLCPWSGICVGWGWTPLDSGMKNNHIDYNEVSEFGTLLHDCGGVYTLSNQPGSSIIGNKFGPIPHAAYATNNRAFYIYLDEATDGFTIRDNEMPEVKIGTNQPGKHLKIEQ